MLRMYEIIAQRSLTGICEAYPDMVRTPFVIVLNNCPIGCSRISSSCKFFGATHDVPFTPVSTKLLCTIVHNPITKSALTVTRRTVNIKSFLTSFNKGSINCQTYWVCSRPNTINNSISVCVSPTIPVCAIVPVIRGRMARPSKNNAFAS